MMGLRYMINNVRLVKSAQLINLKKLPCKCAETHWLLRRALCSPTETAAASCSVLIRRTQNEAVRIELEKYVSKSGWGRRPKCRHKGTAETINKDGI